MWINFNISLLGSGGMLHATLRYILHSWFPHAIFLMMALVVPLQGENERSAGGTRVAYDFLDRVESEVGQDVFDSVSYPHALFLSESLLFLDLESLTPATFVGHLRHVHEMKTRFYRTSPLTDEEIKSDLLPLRIRNEFTKPDWLKLTAASMRNHTGKAQSADEAAAGICKWMTKNLTLLDPEDSYPLPARGELDPLSVLKGRHGTELDLAIFGVAAMRSVGLAARLVWAPALRGGAGGKVWLEYLGEDRSWKPWIPSFGTIEDHKAEYRKRLGGQTVFIMARPGSPIEITGDYVETITLRFEKGGPEDIVSLLVVGNGGLMSARGTEPMAMRNETTARIGRGPVIAAASFANLSFALLPIDPPSDCGEMTILANDRRLIQSNTQAPSKITSQ